MSKIFFSGLLRPQSSNRLLKNFRDFLSLEKKLEDLQQELYQYILAQPPVNPKNCITFTRKGLLSFFMTEKAVPDLLLPCVLASGVPIKDIKTITAQLRGGEVTTPDWESLNILTGGGAVIQELECSAALYSPVIQEIIKQGKLLNLR